MFVCVKHALLEKLVLCRHSFEPHLPFNSMWILCWFDALVLCLCHMPKSPISCVCVSFSLSSSFLPSHLFTHVHCVAFSQFFFGCFFSYNQWIDSFLVDVFLWAFAKKNSWTQVEIQKNANKRRRKKMLWVALWHLNTVYICMDSICIYFSRCKCICVPKISFVKEAKEKFCFSAVFSFIFFIVLYDFFPLPYFELVCFIFKFILSFFKIFNGKKDRICGCFLLQKYVIFLCLIIIFCHSPFSKQQKKFFICQQLLLLSSTCFSVTNKKQTFAFLWYSVHTNFTIFCVFPRCYINNMQNKWKKNADGVFNWLRRTSTHWKNENYNNENFKLTKSSKLWNGRNLASCRFMAVHSII